MTPAERDDHNRSVLVQCNGFVRSGNGPWMPARRSANGGGEVFYEPTGIKLARPDAFRPATLDQIVAELARDNALACTHLALVR